MRYEIELATPVERTFRVEQMAGMFDLELPSAEGGQGKGGTAAAEAEARESFAFELPEHDADWKIGLIVGPSGSGKSTLARAAYGSRLFTGARWPAGQAVLDGFPETADIRQITSTLSSVGFSSPPSWLKPYRVLSQGEQFRANLARALLAAGDDLVAFDEFTSVVDRTVAKIASAAVARSIRKGNLPCRFVAVTCHYDVAEWLEPDWVLDTGSGELSSRQDLPRGWLRRPEIKLDVEPCHRSLWKIFRRHHYLSGHLLNSARCFLATWEGRPVAFSAWVARGAAKRDQDARREHRTVVLPDFQGVGIGNRLSAFCASIWRGLGKRAFSTTSHPAMIRHRAGSPLWRVIRLGRASACRRPMEDRYRNGKKPERITGGFEYVGPAMDCDLARRYVTAAVTPSRLSDRGEAVLGLLADGGGLSRQVIAARLGVTVHQAGHALAELLALGLLDRRRVGRRRIFFKKVPSASQPTERS